MDSARKTAIKALVKMDKDKSYSNIVLNQTIKNSDLDNKDIAFTSALFYGVLERMITLDYIINSYSKIKIKKMMPEVRAILRTGIYQLKYMEKIPDSAAVNEAVAMAKSFRVHRAGPLINAVLRSFIRADKLYPIPKDSALRKSIEYSMPVWLITLWMESYGSDRTDKILEKVAGRPPLTIRVNANKINADDLIQKFENLNIKAEKVSWLENAVKIENAGAIDKLPMYKEGLFHVQDTASQLCCKSLEVNQGDEVYDVCAAPGGKSFTLAQYGGDIHAFDLFEHKINLMKSGAERLDLNLKVDIRDAANAEDKLEEVNRILCDVPCSGFGIIRRKPEIRYKDEAEFKDLSEIQYKILCESSKLLKEGGIMIYSTCTLNPKENGEIIDKFLKEHNDFKGEKLNLPKNAKIIDENDYEVTLFPDALDTDGFYIAKLKRCLS